MAALRLVALALPMSPPPLRYVPLPLRHVLSTQTAGGGWAGSATLRVPRQSDPRPWQHRAAGTYAASTYADGGGRMTTAHVLQVLVELTAPAAVEDSDECEGRRWNHATA